MLAADTMMSVGFLLKFGRFLSTSTPLRAMVLVRSEKIAGGNRTNLGANFKYFKPITLSITYMVLDIQTEQRAFGMCVAKVH